jgi:hypothetical protein
VKYDWQTKLLFQLAYYINDIKMLRMLVSLDTGHSKSLIIQLLGDILIGLGKKSVLVICSNKFFAYYGRSHYGTTNVTTKRIEYLPFRHFLMRKPRLDTIILVDEIDYMLSNLSF